MFPKVEGFEGVSDACASGISTTVVLLHKLKLHVPTLTRDNKTGLQAKHNTEPRIQAFLRGGHLTLHLNLLQLRALHWGGHSTSCSWLGR